MRGGANLSRVCDHGVSCNRIGKKGVELFADHATPGQHHNPRCSQEKRPRIWCDQVGAQRKHGAPGRSRVVAGTGMAAAQGDVDGGLQILDIGGRVLVEDHQIDRKLPSQPVLMGL